MEVKKWQATYFYFADCEACAEHDAQGGVEALGHYSETKG